jgi:hypothetical protein
VKEQPGFPVTACVANGRAFQEGRKEGHQEVRGEEGETKEMTLPTAGFVSQDMLTIGALGSDLTGVASPTLSRLDLLTDPLCSPR